MNPQMNSSSVTTASTRSTSHSESSVIIGPRSEDHLAAYLRAADGRVLAEDIHAPDPIPDTPKSAVDGYALRAADGVAVRAGFHPHRKPAVREFGVRAHAAKVPGELAEVLVTRARVISRSMTFSLATVVAEEDVLGAVLAAFDWMAERVGRRDQGEAGDALEPLPLVLERGDRVGEAMPWRGGGGSCRGPSRRRAAARSCG